MADYIDRQSAIDKFEPWLDVSGYSEGELNMLKAVLYELRFLPSAHPEQRWIPCSERLPEVSYDYLGNWSSPEVILLMNDEEYTCVCNGHFNPVGVFEVDEKDGAACVGRPVEHVKAWMPLPEPYEVKP